MPGSTKQGVHLWREREGGVSKGNAFVDAIVGGIDEMIKLEMETAECWNTTGLLWEERSVSKSGWVGGRREKKKCMIRSWPSRLPTWHGIISHRKCEEMAQVWAYEVGYSLMTVLLAPSSHITQAGTMLWFQKRKIKRWSDFVLIYRNMEFGIFMHKIWNYELSFSVPAEFEKSELSGITACSHQMEYE